MSLVELKKALSQKGLVIGTKTVIDGIKSGKIKKVFLAENCRDDVVRDIEYVSKIMKIEIIKINKTNQELGTLCKKPFSVSVLGY